LTLCNTSVFTQSVPTDPLHPSPASHFKKCRFKVGRFTVYGELFGKCVLQFLYSPQKAVSSGCALRHPYVVRRNENPEHVFTSNHRYGVLLQHENWKKRQQIVTVRNRYVTNAILGLEKRGVFLISVMVPQMEENLRTSDSYKKHSVTWV
jgi:hypothetical protein